MSATSRKVAAMKGMLLSKGFVLRGKKHHEIYWFQIDGRISRIHTFFSHGAKRYDRQLLAEVKRQIRLHNWDDFDNFMDCGMTSDQYRRKMLAEGHVIP